MFFGSGENPLDVQPRHHHSQGHTIADVLPRLQQGGLSQMSEPTDARALVQVTFDWCS